MKITPEILIGLGFIRNDKYISDVEPSDGCGCEWSIGAMGFTIPIETTVLVVVKEKNGYWAFENSGNGVDERMHNLEELIKFINDCQIRIAYKEGYRQCKTNFGKGIVKMILRENEDD